MLAVSPWVRVENCTIYDQNVSVYTGKCCSMWVRVIIHGDMEQNVHFLRLSTVFH